MNHLDIAEQALGPENSRLALESCMLKDLPGYSTIVSYLVPATTVVLGYPNYSGNSSSDSAIPIFDSVLVLAHRLEQIY